MTTRAFNDVLIIYMLCVLRVCVFVRAVTVAERYLPAVGGAKFVDGNQEEPTRRSCIANEGVGRSSLSAGFPRRTQINNMTPS